MPDLHAGRTGRITASRIGAVLGVNKYQSADDVLAEMVRQYHNVPSTFQGNLATEYGNEHEQDAIDEYERRHGVLVWGQQQFRVHPQVDWLAVTPDGLVGADGGIEVKCPFRARYTHIDQKPEYEAQVRLQQAVFGRPWWDFVVWRGHRDLDEGVWVCDTLDVSRVKFDPDWLPDRLPVLREFMDRYEATINDPVLYEPIVFNEEK